MDFQTLDFDGLFVPGIDDYILNGQKAALSPVETEASGQPPVTRGDKHVDIKFFNTERKGKDGEQP
jgi:hypothetical protein